MSSIHATSLLDTNILLRFALNDHEDHSARTRRFLAEVAIGRQRTYLPDTAIFEAIFTLEKSYRMPRSAIMSILDELLDMEGLIVSNRPLLDEALTRWETTRKLSFADSYHLSLAKAMGLPDVISFDREMSRDPAVRRSGGSSRNRHTRLRSTRLRT